MTQAAKLIFPTQNVAEAIRAKLAETKGTPDITYSVVKVTTGWQVCRISKCPDYMPPAKPAPVAKTEMPKLVAQPSLTQVTVELPLVGETPEYLKVKVGQKVVYLQKAKVQYGLVGKLCTVTLDKKLAAKYAMI